MLEFLKEQGEVSNSPEGIKVDGQGFILDSGDIVLPPGFKGEYLLEIEFESFVIKNLYKFMSTMNESAGNGLFGFAERTLYEFITSWVFLFVHPQVRVKHRHRLAALLFAGHFKLIEQDMDVYRRYMERHGQYLTGVDKQRLNEVEPYYKFFDYVWEVRKGIANFYEKNLSHSFLKDLQLEQIIAHQHMRVHANPMSLNENNSDYEKVIRHKLLLAYYLRQIIDYYRHIDGRAYERLKYRYEKFVKNNKIRL